MEGENNTQNQATSQTPAPVVPQADNTLLMGILAYIGILVLIPLLTAKDNPVVKFHVKQGLVLFIIEVVAYVVLGMLFIPLFISQIINLAAIVFSIIGIINVVQKKEDELPFIGSFAKHINI